MKKLISIPLFILVLSGVLYAKYNKAIETAGTTGARTITAGDTLTSKVYELDDSEYIAPDASQAQTITSVINQQTKQLYASIGTKAGYEDGVQPQSGASKAYDLDELNKMLKAKSANLEKLEKWVVGMFGRWMDISIECDVQYPQEFDLRSLADDLVLASELVLLDIGPTFNTEVLREVAAKVLDRTEPSTLQKIFAEIEERQNKKEEMMEADEVEFDPLEESPVNKKKNVIRDSLNQSRAIVDKAL
jgi:hypothetical protein